MKSIFEIGLIFLLIITVITHLLKIVYIFFKPPIFLKIDTISNPQPSKFNLVIYYSLTIGVCLYVIFQKASFLNF